VGVVRYSLIQWMPSILTLIVRRPAMAASAAQQLPASSIVVPGQLTLRTFLVKENLQA